MNSISYPFRGPAPWLALLSAVLFAVYWPGLGGGYVFDDFANIVDNTRLHVDSLRWHDWIAAVFSSDAGPVQRPLAMLSFALQHYLTGLDPWPMKLANLTLHVLNMMLVFGLARATLLAAQVDDVRAGTTALLVAALWALLPINFLAVMFIVQRMEVLSHTFVFAGLWMYLVGRLRMQDGRPGWTLSLAGLCGGTVLGLLSKESAALLPLYALCLEIFVLGFRTQGTDREPRLVWLYLIVLVAPAVAGLAWLWPKVASPGAWAGRDFSLVERLWTEPRVVLDYLHWTLLPDLGRLGLFHDDYVVSRSWVDPPMTLLAILAMVALAIMAWALRRRRPLASLGLAWFLGAQLLTATILPLELVYEHRNYFASLGLVLALADLLQLAPTRPGFRQVGTTALIALAVLYAGLTHLRAREWRDPLMFAVTSAAKHPDSPRATYQLAQTYVILSAEAAPELTDEAFEALERARAVQGSNLLPAQALLILAARTGRPMQEEWWSDLHDKLRNRPIGPQELGALGAMTRCAVAEDCQFPRRKMMALYMAPLARRPHAELLTLYGDYALNVLHDPQLALRMWTEATHREPHNAQYRVNLTKLLIAMGYFDSAKSSIEQLRRDDRWGENESLAIQLQLRLDQARSRASLNVVPRDQ